MRGNYLFIFNIEGNRVDVFNIEDPSYCQKIKLGFAISDT